MKKYRIMGIEHEMTIPQLVAFMQEMCKAITANGYDWREWLKANFEEI